MKVEMRLYKTFDADLISLNSNGISISSLMKRALEYYVKGQLLNFYVPECMPYNLDGKHRSIHIVFSVSDPASVQFLRNEIKDRQRAAFFKALVRGCIMYPTLGVYLRHSDTIAEETRKIKEMDLDNVENLDVLSFTGKKRHRTAYEILKPAGAPKQEPVERKERRTDMERFGDVADLAYIDGKPAAKKSNRTNIEQIIEERKEEAAVVEAAAASEEVVQDDDRKSLFDQLEALRYGA